MAPPPPPLGSLPQQQRRHVLSEEEFTSTLSAIVQRDYFPDLPDLERQAAILERRSQGDVVGAVALRRAVRRLKEHEELLAAEIEEGENDVVGDDNNTMNIHRRIPRPLEQESLSGFHARVTNEDDDEFDSNQKRQIRENRERLDKLLRPSPPKVPLLMMSEMASDQFQATPNRIAASEWNAPSMKNSLFFSPTTPLRKNGADGGDDGVEMMKRITNGDQKDSSTPASQELMLMPPPANVSRRPLAKHQLVEYVPKHTLEKRIEPSQTRFPNKIIPYPPTNSTNTRSGLFRTTTDSSSSSAWETETDGSVTDASTDLDAPLRPIHEERRLERQRRERNQHSYVAMTPVIIPGVTGNESPITTWGTVDGTPMVISGREQPLKDDDDDESNRIMEYGMAGESRRDKAARKAAEKLARRAKRAKSASSSSTATSRSVSTSQMRFNNGGTPSLTPAALSLFRKTSEKASSRSGDAFASSLRSSYTPKIRSGSSTPRSVQSQGLEKKFHHGTKDNAFNSTPLATRK